MELHPGSGHHAHHKHGGRGGIGPFQHALDQYGSVIHHEYLKEGKYRHHHKIEPAQSKDAAVNLPKAFALNPLAQSQQPKPQYNTKGNQAQPIRGGIQEQMHPCQVMHPAVHGRKPHGGSFRPDGLNVNHANQHRPQSKCRQHTDRGANFLSIFFSHIVSLPSVDSASACIHFTGSDKKRQETPGYIRDTLRVIAFL